ncbi:hypothetical protein U1Q18_031914 [Sarracenia purpurea var. burkii]
MVDWISEVEQWSRLVLVVARAGRMVLVVGDDGSVVDDGFQRGSVVGVPGSREWGSARLGVRVLVVGEFRKWGFGGRQLRLVGSGGGTLYFGGGGVIGAGG